MKLRCRLGIHRRRTIAFYSWATFVRLRVPLADRDITQLVACRDCLWAKPHRDRWSVDDWEPLPTGDDDEWNPEPDGLGDHWDPSERDVEVDNG